MKTFYCYFRGGGGADVGAELAGYTSVGGVEFDPAIAAACDVNFPHAPTTVADVCSVDPATLLSAAPDWFHASPSCRNASQANADSGETDEDREAGKAVHGFITTWTPPVVTIENVWGYRGFDAFAYILRALEDNGYSYEYWHLNAANYGVPQTRKRLILIAKRWNTRIQRPEPTHRDGGDMFLPAWNGWYSAIEDLIPTLPESRFAAWQLARLPALCQTTVIEGDTAGPREIGTRSHDAPIFTVKANVGMSMRAFIVDGTANDQGRTVTVRNGNEPMMTVSANGDKRKMRAFLVDGQNGGRDISIRNADEPMITVSAGNKGMARAFLIGGANTSEDQAASGVGVSAAHEPTRCVNASNSSHWRAWLDQGRVVSMSPRALSRFQSFPDAYVLPAKTALACQIVGNAVPPLLMQKIGESL